MATITRFEDLEIWKRARQLAATVNLKISEGRFGKDFGLIDQINRSTGSVMDNIAEGFERDGRQEFIQFLSYSKGSAGEVRSQLHRAFDRKYISDKEFIELKLEAEEISKGIKNLIVYLTGVNHRGQKYKVEEEFESYQAQPET